MSSSSTKAKAVCFLGAGDVDVIGSRELLVHPPGRGEVLVEVAAAGLNRADLLQRKGLYPAPPGVVADVPGLEYSGTVQAIGDDVRDVVVGQRVMGIVSGGGMATHLLAHEREVITVPAGLDLVEAAAIPEAFLTAYDALLQGQVALGRRVLIHAVTSGVGTAALQLARAWGALVVGTSRSPEKLERASPLGLSHAIHVVDGQFAAAVRGSTGGQGADAIIDLVGGAYLSENLEAAARKAHIVVVGLLGGQKGELALRTLLNKRLTLIGTVLRSRPPEEKAALAQRFGAEVVPLFTARELRPIVEEVLPMTEVREAHQRLASNTTFGKLVLKW